MAGKLQELWEAQLGATVLWAPVALTFGIWTYFALPQEPALPLTGFFMLLAIVAVLESPRPHGNAASGHSAQRICTGENPR